MILMALAHVREFYHVGAMSFQPDDLSKTPAALFFTRWITHFCAPVFMFTAGVGAFFWLRRPGRTPRDLSRFLWTRGAWLILLELTLMRVIMLGNPAGQPIFLVILWSLGLAMILTGFLIR